MNDYFSSFESAWDSRSLTSSPSPSDYSLPVLWGLEFPEFNNDDVLPTDDEIRESIRRMYAPVDGSIDEGYETDRSSGSDEGARLKDRRRRLGVRRIWRRNAPKRGSSSEGSDGSRVLTHDGSRIDEEDERETANNDEDDDEGEDGSDTRMWIEGVGQLARDSLELPAAHRVSRRVAGQRTSNERGRLKRFARTVGRRVSRVFGRNEGRE